MLRCVECEVTAEGRSRRLARLPHGRRRTGCVLPGVRGAGVRRIGRVSPDQRVLSAETRETILRRVVQFRGRGACPTGTLSSALFALQDRIDGEREDVPAKIHLNDGLMFVVNEPFEDVERVYEEALATNGLFRIKNGTDKVHTINPSSVAFIENVEPVQVQARDSVTVATETVRAESGTRVESGR